MKIYSQIQKLASAIAIGGLMLASASAQAEYPERPVTIVVPLSAGGVTDTVARLLGKRLSEELGKPFVIENKPGAGGAIGAESVANAKADGYTLIMGTVSSHAINPSVYKSLRYDNIKDFMPVSLVAQGPNLLVVNPSVPVKTVPELIQWIKDNPGKVSYGSTGVGTSTHLAAELFKQMTGVDMVHVPYKGSAPMMTDLISGQVQLAFDNMPTALAQAKADKLRAIAVTSKSPWPLEPGIPTVDASLPGYEIVSWQGLFAPAKSPGDIVEKLSATTQKIMHEPEMVQRLQELGTNAIGSSSTDFSQFVAAETSKWAEVAQKAGVTLQ
ncbi:MAG: tripartite tricarboxylate transporter substrate binding protein [Pusillimonas sp.]